MRALLVVLSCLVLLAPGDALAKEKKGAKKAEKKPAKKQPGSANDIYRQLSGDVQPLPKPTDLSLAFEVDVTDAAAFSVEVSAAAAATEPAAAMGWVVADWRKQMGTDIKWLAHYRRLIAAELRKAQRDDFAVAVRYLTGLFDSADQFLRLAEQSREQFNAEFTSDRDREKMPAPPEIARRIRLYRDRAQTLYGNAQSFVARTVKDRESKIVRIE